MEAIDRVLNYSNWMPLVLVSALLLLVLLKMMHTSKLAGYSKAFIVKGFIEKTTEEKASYFSLFSRFLFVFSSIIFSIMLLLFKNQGATSLNDFQVFTKIFLGVLVYLFCLQGIDFVLNTLFQVKNEVAYFMTAKKTYLHNIAIWIFPFLIINIYGFDTSHFAGTVFIFLLVLSEILIIFNNKKLIFNRLFYFILYICVIQVAPLLIIYKIFI